MPTNEERGGLPNLNEAAIMYRHLRGLDASQLGDLAFSHIARASTLRNLDDAICANVYALAFGSAAIAQYRPPTATALTDSITFDTTAEGTGTGSTMPADLDDFDSAEAVYRHLRGLDASQLADHVLADIARASTYHDEDYEIYYGTRAGAIGNMAILRQMGLDLSQGDSAGLLQ